MQVYYTTQHEFCKAKLQKNIEIFAFLRYNDDVMIQIKEENHVFYIM